MVLESLRPDAPINVRSLVIEEPTKPDPLEITPGDWQGMNEYLLKSFEHYNQFGVTQMSKLMKVLAPEKRNNVISGWNLDVDYFTRSTVLDTDPTYLAAVKILFPESDPNKYFEDLSQKVFVNNMITRIRPQLTDSTSPFEISDITSNWPKVLTLFPQLAESTPIAKEKVEQIKNRFETGYKGGTNYARVLSHIRLFIPKELIPGEMDSKDWDNLAGELSKYRANRNWLRFAETAEIIKILKADEVKITENGWEFKMPPAEKFASPLPPLPEARKF